MTHFLGIDLGASSLKLSLIDGDARLVAMARAPLVTAFPAAGQAEQNPADWCAALKSALTDLSSDLSAADKLPQLAAICLSGGAHIGVLCDAHAVPLRPAIMWSDQRASAEAAALADDPSVRATALNQPNPTWTLAHLRWLAAHEPAALANCEKFYFAKDWLRSQLTGDHACDFGDMVGGMLADFTAGTWSQDLVAAAGLAESALPSLHASTAIAGTVTPEAASAFGLPVDTPVVTGSIDTSVEFLCCAPLDADTASLKLASAGVLAFSDTSASPHPPVSLYPHILDGAVYHAAGMNACSQAIDWVGQTLLGGRDATAMAELAATAPIGANGVVFHPYLAGERAPLWDASLTAQVSGLSRATHAADVARAAFEGVGHALSEIWHDMTDKLGRRPARLHVMGGGAHSDFWCQMLADMLNLPLRRAKQTDCSFAGALLAAHAVGHFATLAEAAAAGYQSDGEFAPDKANHAVYSELQLTFRERRPS